MRWSALLHKPITLVFLVWCALVAAGTLRVVAYESAAGETSAPPRVWPNESRLHKADRPTLTMFLHPRCPCSRASVAELSGLIQKVGDRATYNVVFFKPENASEGWERTDTYRSVSKMPQVRVLVDHEGEEARRFKAATSGETVLYDRAGKLQFHGGVTLSRGHLGDNPGRRSLQSLLRDDPTSRSRTPVFGCPLLTPAENSERNKR